jgi:hypothetical protein
VGLLYALIIGIRTTKLSMKKNIEALKLIGKRTFFGLVDSVYPESCSHGVPFKSDSGFIFFGITS